MCYFYVRFIIKTFILPSTALNRNKFNPFFDVFGLVFFARAWVMSGLLINNKILHFSTRIMQKKSYKGDDNEIIELSRIKKSISSFAANRNTTIKPIPKTEHTINLNGNYSWVLVTRLFTYNCITNAIICVSSREMKIQTNVY